jgi:Predicted transcriptional regulator
MFPRTPFNRARIRQVVKALRYGHYKISINKINEILKISPRTVDRHLKELRKAGFKRFYAGRAQYRRSKNFPGIVNSKGLFLSIEVLRIRLTAFIFGLLDTIEEALEGDPF